MNVAPCDREGECKKQITRRSKNIYKEAIFYRATQQQAARATLVFIATNCSPIDDGKPEQTVHVCYRIGKTDP